MESCSQRPPRSGLIGASMPQGLKQVARHCPFIEYGRISLQEYYVETAREYLYGEIGDRLEGLSETRGLLPGQPLPGLPGGIKLKGVHYGAGDRYALGMNPALDWVKALW